MTIGVVRTGSSGASLFFFFSQRVFHILSASVVPCSDLTQETVIQNVLDGVNIPPSQQAP